MNKIPLVALALALFTGCDSDESSTQPPTDELAAADTDAAALEASPEEGKHWRHGKKHHRNPASHLCADLGCTAEQQTQIEALFEHRKGEKHERPDHSEANTALANAFRGNDFSVADLETFHQAVRPPEDRGAKHLEKMAQLHAILNPEQRNALAEKFESEGLMGGPRHRHGEKWKHRDGERDPTRAAEHVKRRVESLCEPLSCTDEQVTKLEAILSQAMADRPKRPEDDGHRQAMADAMRSSAFDADALRERFEADDGRQERHAKKAEVLVAVHAVLDQGQRDILATKIEEHGPRALMGKRGHKRGKHRRGGRRGGPDKFEQK